MDSLAVVIDAWGACCVSYSNNEMLSIQPSALEQQQQLAGVTQKMLRYE